MNQNSLRLKHRSISFLISLVFSVGLPLLFFFLFLGNLSGTQRDILPAFDDPLEVVGFWGLIVMCIPAIMIYPIVLSTFEFLNATGIITLSEYTRIIITALISAGGQVAIWLWIVSSVRKVIAWTHMSHRFKEGA